LVQYRYLEVDKIHSEFWNPKNKKFFEVKSMLVEFDLPHWCCGPKGCQLEIEYGELIDAEDAH
jgi:hypothetical protein